MSIIAIITARGGSKRICKKNIKEFMGKPIIAYAIENALNSKLFYEVMVSTENVEIANTARKYGAKIPFMRSQNTSNDYATVVDVLIEVVNEYNSLGKNFDALCCIYPCVPFLRSEMLRLAYAKFQNYDALQSVCKYSVPVEWAMSIENELLVPTQREALNVRSQDLKPKYYDAGMFYFCKIDKLLQYQSLVPPKTAAYVINELECQDIDTMDDWRLAEMKYKILHNIKS